MRTKLLMAEFILDLFPLSLLFKRSNTLLDGFVVQDFEGEITCTRHTWLPRTVLQSVGQSVPIAQLWV